MEDLPLPSWWSPCTWLSVTADSSLLFLCLQTEGSFSFIVSLILEIQGCYLEGEPVHWLLLGYHGPYLEQLSVYKVTLPSRLFSTLVCPLVPVCVTL